MHFCGEGGILTYILPHFISFHKIYNNQHFIYGIILYYFAIFRIKLGDYLGDYYIFALKKEIMVIAYKHSISVSLGNKYKNGAYSIRLRVCYGRKRTDLHTRLSATTAQWDTKRQRYKQGCSINGTPYNILNSTIDTYIGFVNDYFNKASLREALPTLDELKRQYNYTFKQSPQKQSGEFFYAFDQYIKTRSETRHWTTEYKEMFTRVCNSLKTFKSDLRFTDFSTEFLNKYLNFLSSTMYNDKIGKVLSMLREFLKYANQKNFPVNKEFFEFDPNLPKSQKAIRYLTLDELQRIIQLPLKKGSALDMTRDFFVFQCFTALRYSDLKRLKNENIRQTDSGYLIDILTEKDNDRISFPLSQVATDIYLKYKNNLYDNNVVFPVISNQKYNEHLKELGRLAELQGHWIDYQYRLKEVEEIRTPKANLTSHTARRTFITTALNEGISESLIAQITSHADIEIMRPYITTTERGKQMVIDALDKATMNVSKIGN